MFCPSCGKTNPDDARFCDGCGSDMTAAKVSPPPPPPPPPPAYQAPVAPVYQAPRAQYTPAPADDLTKPLSVGGFLGTMIVLCIPIVGIIMFFVWCFGSRVNKNRKNFVRAYFWLLVIGFVLSIVCSIVMWTLIAQFMNSTDFQAMLQDPTKFQDYIESLFGNLIPMN